MSLSDSAAFLARKYEMIDPDVRLMLQVQNDNAAAFERATQERFKDLRAKGLMPIQKGGRILPGRNVGAQSGGGGQETLWSRLGIGGKK